MTIIFSIIETLGKYRIPLTFVVISWILFYPSYQYGMVTDFLSWMLKYQNGDWSDVANCFGYPGLHHFFHAINYCLYKCVGPSHFAWYVILSGMHGLVAHALYNWLTDFDRIGIINLSNLWITMISLTFLVFPYNIEAVVWKACLHYLILSFMFLNGLRWLGHYLHQAARKHLFLIHLMFVLSLFTLELSYAFPLACGAFIGFYKLQNPRFKILPALLKISSVQIIIFLLYLFLTKLTIGDYIGHYGAEKHMVFEPVIILGHAWSYFFKNLLFVHYWTFKDKSWFYTEILTQPIVHIGLTLIAGIILSFVIYKWKTLNKNLKFSALQLLLFFIAISPIVNLYFMWLLYYENDRYGYLANCFWVPFIIILLKQLSERIKGLTISVYVISCIALFLFMIFHCNSAGTNAHRLLDSFPKISPDKEYFIASIPDNHRGLYLYRDYTDDAIAFRESLGLFRGRSQDISLIDVSQYNQHLTSDSIKFDFINDSTVHIGFRQRKNWFWRKGIGISNYENDTLKVVKKPGYLRVTIKSPHADQRFLYPEAGTWKEEAWPQFSH